MNLRARIAFSAVFGAALATSASAQLSAYYTTDGTSGTGFTHVFQAGSESFNYQWAAPGEMPIVVGNFGSGIRVRQAVGQPNSGAPEPGDEYLTNGTPTGFHNLWNPGSGGITGYDAGFDGTSIYMVDWNGPTPGEVCRYDNNYGNRTPLFMANPNDLGITYDSGTNTIWTNNYYTGQVSQWSMTGTALSSFNIGSSSGALAYDSQDGTLWMSNASSGSILLHYTRQGQLLGSYSTPYYLLGGEMAAVPEPATCVALGLGLLTALRRRRRA